jgi:hypothetical protein
MKTTRLTALGATVALLLGSVTAYGQVSRDIQQKELDLAAAQDRLLGVIQEDLNTYNFPCNNIRKADCDDIKNSRHQRFRRDQEDLQQEIRQRQSDLLAARQRALGR